jgi:hypothetical protein
VLDIEIAGTAPNLVAHLNVTGHLTLQTGSVLVVDFINGFAPKMGEKFDFLTSPNITGQFSQVQIEGLQPGFLFNVGPDGTGAFGLTALNNGISSVPEPSPAALFTIGLLLFLATRARKRA